MAITKVVNNGFGAYKASETDVKPSWGIERIPFNGIVELDDETGDDGAVAHALNTGDPRIRFVGTGWQVATDDSSSKPETNVIGDYIEFTFFGTHLNLLCRPEINNVWSAVVNGGTPFDIQPTFQQSSILNSRNVKTNIIVPVAIPTEAPRMHTVRIIRSTQSAADQRLYLYGCELINEKADTTTDIDISDGDIFSDGYRYRVENGDANDSLPPIIPDGMLSDRGARVVTYLDPADGTFGQVIQNVDSAQANFASTDHSNEDIIRRINFREFGANNQFATLGDNSGSAANLAFTLDDGTTTLVGVGVYVIPGTNSPGNYVSIGAIIAANQRSLTFTFVGTGLDVLWKKSGALINDFDVSVDGLSIGQISQTVSFDGILPIVSGLAYGTHTVRFINAGNNENDAGITDFLIYGSSKPTIPAGAVEIADYNIMADFVGTVGSTTATLNRDRIGTGTLRKMSTREFLYLSEGISGPDLDVAAISGYQINLENGNVPFFYTFYGTGCEFRFSTRANKILNFFIDQPTATGETATPLTLTQDNFFSPASGQTFVIADNASGTHIASTIPVTTNGQVTITGTPLANAGFRVTGLPLGVHTISAQGRSSSMAFRPRCVDVITPIHYQEDTLKVGNSGIGDVRPDFANIAAEAEVINNLGEAKAWVNYDTNTNTIASSYNISAIVETSGGQRVIVYFDKPFKDNSYICCPAIEPSGNTSAATIQIDRQPGQAGTRDSKTAGGCTLLSNSIGTFTCSFFGELIDE